MHLSRMRHLICIKLVFLFQSASMTVLYPYINLHMKSLGMTIEETAIVNAVIPVLFIFTPPLAGFLADKIGNFRILLCFLTGSGGLVSLLLLLIPTGIFVSSFPNPCEELITIVYVLQAGTFLCIRTS